MIKYLTTCSAYDQYLNRVKALRNKFMLRGFQRSFFTSQFYPNLMVVITSTNATYQWVGYRLTHFIPNAWPVHRHLPRIDLRTALVQEEGEDNKQ